MNSVTPVTPPAENRFSDLFGRPPELKAKAPGRTNLIGDHIDYLGGCVLPAAIDRHIEILVAPSSEPSIQIASEHCADSDVHCLDLHEDQPRDKDEAWLNYLIGVLAVYRSEGIASKHGFNAYVTSTLPAGAGLSSSAALEAAMACIVEHLADQHLSPLERALLCQRAEHEYAGVPCGLMDQLAVCAGQEDTALWIDCSTNETRTEKLPDHLAFVIANSGVSHQLSDGGYAKRKAECAAAEQILRTEYLAQTPIQKIETHQEELGDVCYRRSRHAATENQRVHGFIAALRAGNQQQSKELTLSSHESLRDDFEVSCPELDHLVAAAHGYQGECWGARMTGGGFGGSTVNLVAKSEVNAFKAHLEATFQDRFYRKPVIFSTSPASGAGIFALD